MNQLLCIMLETGMIIVFQSSSDKYKKGDRLTPRKLRQAVSEGFAVTIKR